MDSAAAGSRRRQAPLLILWLRLTCRVPPRSFLYSQKVDLGSGLRALDLAAPFPVALGDGGVGAEEGVLGHVRRGAAAGHGAADGLGDGADVVRGGAAAEPDVAHVELQAGACEVRAFVAVAGEGIERGRERAIPGNTGAGRIGQGLKGRLCLGGAVGHRPRSAEHTSELQSLMRTSYAA